MVTELIKASFEILVKNAVHLDTVLETFVIEDHSVAVMACLMAKLQTLGNSPSRESFEKLLAQLSDFLTNCKASDIGRRGARENCTNTISYLIQFNIFIVSWGTLS